MTRAEVMKKPIWMSRLIFKASILYGKKYKDLTDDEEYEMRLQILQEQAELEAKQQAQQEYYKSKGYGRF